MYLFLSTTKFSTFVRDLDIEGYLNVFAHVQIPEALVHENLSIVLFNLLKGIYELGDVSRLRASNFNVLFCLEEIDNNIQVNDQAVEKCIESLAEFLEDSDENTLTLLVPDFADENMLNQFIETFADIYKDSGVNKNLAVVTVAFFRNQLNIGTDN